MDQAELIALRGAGVPSSSTCGDALTLSEALLHTDTYLLLLPRQGIYFFPFRHLSDLAIPVTCLSHYAAQGHRDQAQAGEAGSSDIVRSSPSHRHSPSYPVPARDTRLPFPSSF